MVLCWEDHLVSQPPRTGGEPLSLTKDPRVSCACTIHLFALKDEKPARRRLVFFFFFFLKEAKEGKILDPVTGRITCPLREIILGRVFKRRQRTQDKRGADRRKKFLFYCWNNQGIAA